MERSILEDLVQEECLIIPFTKTKNAEKDISRHKKNLRTNGQCARDF